MRHTLGKHFLFYFFFNSGNFSNTNKKYPQRVLLPFFLQRHFAVIQNDKLFNLLLICLRFNRLDLCLMLCLGLLHVIKKYFLMPIHLSVNIIIKNLFCNYYFSPLSWFLQISEKCHYKDGTLK